MAGSVGSSGVANFAYTSTGVASGVVADVSTSTATGIGVGGSGVSVSYAPAVPAGTIYDRSGSALLDRSGAYIEVRA